MNTRKCNKISIKKSIISILLVLIGGIIIYNKNSLFSKLKKYFYNTFFILWYTYCGEIMFNLEELKNKFDNIGRSL